MYNSFIQESICLRTYQCQDSLGQLLFLTAGLSDIIILYIYNYNYNTIIIYINTGLTKHARMQFLNSNIDSQSVDVRETGLPAVSPLLILNFSAISSIV